MCFFGHELSNYMLVMFFVILAPALHPYQMVRLRECMRNRSRLRELGLPCDEYGRILAEDVAGHSDKNRSEDVHSNKYQSGDSEFEHDPLQDDNGEGGLIDDDNAKVLIPPSCQVLTCCFSS
jgi:hypothetical protein